MNSLELETQETNEMATEKGKLYIDSYKNFAVNPENPRTDYDVAGMVEKIKALGGVKTPILVFDKSFNIGENKEKRVAVDGNTRILALEILANDEQYLSNGGSLDVPFQILPTELAKSEKDIKSYQYVLGTSNNQLSSSDQAKLINELVNLTISEYKADPKWSNSLDSKIKAAAVTYTASITGLSSTIVNEFLRIFSGDNIFLQELVNEKVIAISYASDLLTLENKLNKNGKNIETPELFSLLQKSALERNKANVTSIDLKNVESLLNQDDDTIVDLVKSDLLPFALVGEVVQTAKDLKVETKDVLSEAIEFQGENENKITKKSIDLAKQAIQQIKDSETVENDLTDNSDSVDSTDSSDSVDNNGLETKTKKEPVVFTLEQQKERISEALLYFENLKIKEYPGVLDEDIHKLANSLFKLQTGVETEEIRAVKREELTKKEEEKVEKKRISEENKKARELKREETIKKALEKQAAKEQALTEQVETIES